MRVLGIEVIDLHIDSLLKGILTEERRSFGSGSFIQHWFAIERFPNQMRPKA
jgi:hypothetical protein